MIEQIRAVYERYGFEPVETPQIEYTDALGKFLPDQDRPNEGVFSFQDDDEQWLSLRYDLTAPLARYVAENFDALPKPYRSYRFGYVYRNEKPGPGRFRQFMQFDADTVGSASMAADAEVCMMIADTMEELGIPRGSYVVKVNNRKVLDGVLESLGFTDSITDMNRRLIVLRAIDKLDKFPMSEVAKLLGSGRWDGGEEGKGDFAPGAGLSKEQMEIVFRVAGGRNQSWVRVNPDERPPTNDEHLISGEDFSDIMAYRKDTADYSFEGAYFFSNSRVIEAWKQDLQLSDTGVRGLQELSELINVAQSAGYGSRRVRIASEVVRGLEYYTGPVFEVELTFPIQGDDGKPVRFGSVAGGGRYDGLVGRFRGDDVPATGISIGVSRLMAALQHLKKIDTQAEPGPVVVTVFDADRIADYQKMVASLRTAGIRAELYLGSGKFGAQMKYADKRGSPCAVIQGGDEKAKD